jgi:hypothetical protein
MVTYRTMMLGKQVDREFLIGIIDKILLPSVGLAADAGSPPPHR